MYLNCVLIILQKQKISLKRYIFNTFYAKPFLILRQAFGGIPRTYMHIRWKVFPCKDFRICTATMRNRNPHLENCSHNSAHAAEMECIFI